MLLKHKIALHYLSTSGDEVTFIASPNRAEAYVLTLEDWEEMGSPRILTLTVQPGHHLSEG